MRGSRKIPMISLGGNTDLNVLTYRSVYRGFELLLRKINNSRWVRPADVRFGSKADMRSAEADVR